MTTQEALELAQRYDRLLTRYEDEAIAKIDTALIRAYRQLEAQLRAVYPALQDAPIIRRQAMIAQQLAGLLDLRNATGEYSRALNEAIGLSSQAGSDSVQQMVSLFDDELGQQLADFAGVPLEAIAAQSERATNLLRNKWSQQFADNVTNIISINLTVGRGPTVTARQMRRQLGVTRARSETIARTETISAFDSAAQQRYQDAGLYSQIFSAGDRRVCPICAARCGNVYKTEEIKLPMHPRDRCYRVPYSARWAAKGLVDEEWIKRYHDEGVAAIQAEGFEPDNGLAPFERGIRTNPPKPIWKP